MVKRVLCETVDDGEGGFDINDSDSESESE